MKRRGLEPLSEERVNVTPLIDVVLCLIIFFMICGTLAKDEMLSGNLTVPVAKLGQDIPDQRDRIIINLVPHAVDLPQKLAALDTSKEENRKTIADFLGRQAPEIYVRGRAVTEDQLGALLKQEVSQNKNLKVMIRADQALHYEFVAPILVACARNNVHSVNFATTKSEL